MPIGHPSTVRRSNSVPMDQLPGKADEPCHTSSIRGRGVD